ncbi:hypothetical protein EV702DRAFT_1135099 [Suillus placidus]|uniref:Uncharacterized protein n=1 Tax=Suillus placidus TaxID=48579 RepID=A0A9P6ZP35_9AGAM|nr:hypothetical protein EV702DRAFT_1135099 [Suillus placidus]
MAYIKNSIHSTSITSSRTMRFSIVLAAVAALILSADTVNADCPFLCIRHSDCDSCDYGPTCYFFECMTKVPGLNYGW